MAHTPRILVFAGSTRADSFNKKLAKVAAASAKRAGAETTYVDLRELALPLYDGDLEQSQGLPGNAVKLKELMKSHDGFIIASPEYNSSISGVLKNAIDWASRKTEGESPLEAFTGKVVGLLAASPGALGGLRGLVHLRAILENIGVLVLPDQFAISKAGEAFDDDGNLRDEAQQKKVDGIAEKLTCTIAKLNA